MRRAFSLLVLGLISLTAGPLAADKVVLKDGRTLETKKPPEIRGRQAVLVLADGKLVSIPASEIDTEKTAAAAAKAAEAAKAAGCRSRRRAAPEPRRRRPCHARRKEGLGRPDGPGRRGGASSTRVTRRRRPVTDASSSATCRRRRPRPGRP